MSEDEGDTKQEKMDSKNNSKKNEKDQQEQNDDSVISFDAPCCSCRYDCKAGEPRFCVRAVIHHFLWTKAELPALGVASFIYTNFGEKLIEQSFSSGAIIQQATLVSIGPSQYEIKKRKMSKR